MENKEILSKVDHTLLAAISTWDQIKVICEDAIQYETASVCIPPTFIARAHEAFPNLNLCTVVGFPLGYHTKESKLQETKQALAEGANEIDMVVNLGDVKEGKFDKVTDEIRALKEACGNRILKVIVETCYLTEEEKIALCKCVTEAKADFIKTSTGFGTASATIADIDLLKANIGPNVKMKAAGGIRTKEALIEYVEHGCSRIGCSGAMKALGLK